MSARDHHIRSQLGRVRILSLCNEYHVVALDALGHGESDWLEDANEYTYERHAEAITAFVDAVGLENLIVIGISMGGRNGWTFTLQRPEKVARLVIVDVAPQVPVQVGAIDSVYVRQWREMLIQHEFESIWHALSVTRFVWPLMDVPHEEILKGLQRDLKQLPDGRVCRKWDKRIVEGPDGEFRPVVQMPEETWDKLSEIKCPTLLVRGALSGTLSPELAERMRQTIPNCQVIEVPNAGHGVPSENPSGFEAAVREFLKA